MQANKVRVFKGSETKQLQYDGKPANADAFYWEPADYDGDVLWSKPHADRPTAVREALRAPDESKAAE